jgi:hypothetical protein
LWISIDLTATKSTTVDRPEIAASGNPIDFEQDSSVGGASDHLVLGQGIGPMFPYRPPIDSVSARWTKPTEIAPSTTADVTRFTLPGQTSPTAKTPGRLLSIK